MLKNMFNFIIATFRTDSASSNSSSSSGSNTQKSDTTGTWNNHHQVDFMRVWKSSRDAEEAMAGGLSKVN